MHFISKEYKMLLTETTDGALQVREDAPQFDVLVLGGGGMKGALILGALEALDDLHCTKRLSAVVGTSIGAVIGYLYAIGVSPERQLQMFVRGGCQVNNIRDMFVKACLFDMSVMMTELRRITAEQTGREEMLFGQLAGADLCVVAYNFTKKAQVLYSRKLCPEKNILEVLRHACTIPYAFDPTPDENGDIVIDGGVTNNLAVDVAESEYGAENVCALTIVNVGDSLLGALTDLPMRSSDLLRVETCRRRPTVIELDGGGLGIKHLFFMTEQHKKKLYDRGRETVIDTFVSAVK